MHEARPYVLPCSVALVLVALTGCGDKSATSAAASASSLASGKAAVVAGVMVDAAGIHVDGKRVADAPADTLGVIAGLKDAISSRELGADQPLAIQLPADISCLGGMSVFTAVTSARRAPRVNGERLALTIGERKEMLTLEDAPADSMLPRLTLAFRAGGMVAAANSDCGGAFDVQPQASVEATAKELTKGTPITDGPVQLRCVAGVKLADVIQVFVSTRPKEDATIAFLQCEGRAPSRRFIDPAPFDPNAPKALFGRDDPGPPFAPAKMAPDASSVCADCVRMGGVSVTGALTGDEVKAGMEGRRDLFARCYAAGLVKTPTLMGSVSLRLEIGKSGEVMSLKNAGASLSDAGVVACILEQSVGAMFAAKGATTLATYPVSFAPK